MEEIKFVGLKELEDVDQTMVNTIVSEYYDKIKRSLHNETTLVVHIKSAANEGHRHRYDVKLRAQAPTKIFEANSEEWDLASAIHGTCKDLLKQIEHAFVK